jgi:hypothetical protein
VPLTPGKPPVESVEQFEPTVAPENEKEMDEVGAKPAPTTETVLPTGPLAGSMVKRAV